MTIHIGTRRRMLADPPTSNIADVLKAWREQEHLSQTEAAIRLGVSARTLQGWEMGRPMPYPSLLQRGVNIVARTADPYSLVQSEFPREFAEFLDFVGPSILDAAVRKVDRKLGAWRLDARMLFEDRYFFHEQCVRFVDGSTPFQLDLSDPVAIRAASLIAGINRVKRHLSPHGIFRLRNMVIDNLKPDRDIRQIEHEIRCSTHFGRKRFKVTFADLEGLGKFDLLVETPSASVEIECKTVTGQTGSQIKTELIGSLSEAFRKTVLDQPPAGGSGLFNLVLNRPAADCKNLARQLGPALRSATVQPFHTSDFSLDFAPRPQWQALLDSERSFDLKRQIGLECDSGSHAGYTISGGKVVGLVIRPHKQTALGKRLVEAIKRGADQCTGDKPSVVWLHFVGVAEAEFLALAEFSKAGKGAGLNAIVAKSLHPKASPTDRSHVDSVWFSADRREIHNHLALAPDRLLVPAVSSGGACYRVSNKCRFPNIRDLE